MNKEIWRSWWLSSIAELTNLDLQVTMWLDEHNVNPHWGYVEFMCCYFDDVLGGKDYEGFLKDKWISGVEYKCIKQWHEALKEHRAPNGDDYDEANILNDPNWRAIVAVGMTSKAQLASLLSMSERSILLG
ncbi:hypothetical protein [Hymenobacter tenuis]